MKYHALFVIFEKATKFVVCCKLLVALYGLTCCIKFKDSPFDSIGELSGNQLIHMIINYLRSTSHIRPGVEISNSLVSLKGRYCVAMAMI